MRRARPALLGQHARQRKARDRGNRLGRAVVPTRRAVAWLAKRRRGRRQLERLHALRAHGAPVTGRVLTARRDGRAGRRREHSPRVHLRRREVLRRLPPVGGGTWRAGEERRRADHVDNPGWRRQEREEQAHDGSLDFLTSAFEELAGTLFLHTLEGSCARAEHIAVDSLHEPVLELLDLLLLLGPLPGAGRHVDRVDVLVVLDQRINRLLCKLECNLML